MAVLTLQQASDIAAQAGFVGDGLRLVLAIAQAESSLVTTARNVNSDSHPFPDGVHASTDRGILQINDWWFEHAPGAYPVVTDQQADDPAQAFAAGYIISSKGTDFHLWSTYQNGAYLKYMSTLPGFPFKEQRTEPTDDGKPPENGNMDCVATSAAAGAQFLTGQTTSGDHLKDDEYGESYIGPTAPMRYFDDVTDHLRALHVNVYQRGGTDAGLVAAVHAGVRAGHPVLVMMPSQWDTIFASSDRRNGTMSMHMAVAYDEWAGGFAVMNPWGAFRQYYTDSEWAARLCLGTVWEMYKEGTQPAMVLDISQVSSFFTQVDGNHWKCKQTGKTVQMGLLNAYRNLWPLATLPFLGLPKSEEFGIGANRWAQVFERGILIYDPAHAYDSAPGFPEYYPGKIDDPLTNGTLKGAQDAATQAGRDRDAANAARDAALKQVSDLTAQIADLTRKLAAAADRTELDAALAQVADLTAKLDAARADLDAAQNDLNSANATLTEAEAKLREQGTADAALAALRSLVAVLDVTKEQAA